MSLWLKMAVAVAALITLAPPVKALTLESATVRVDGLDREYYYHRPATVRRAAPMSVVFALHGGAGKADKFADFLNFDTFVTARNLLVVYPQGYERHWNDGRADTTITALQRGIDDIAFLRAVLGALAARFPVDRRWIYAAGISNGGMMILRLACEAADTFAAVAALSASFPEWLLPACRPARPIPVLLMNGTADRMVPYAGGAVGPRPRDRGRVRSTADTVARWVALNGCLGAPQVLSLPDVDRRDRSTVTVERHLPCRRGTEVTLYRIEGGGHTWPGGPQYLPRFLVGPTNRDIDGTAHILDFFARHAMPGDRD